ncbi:16S rRNA (cytosine(1402)-N(4))-methyltransferase RsmH [Peptoniphilus indolicus]|uniref:Ribosomal RNA small subunit methyltransferase H n=2 Tax=Peptoniphilus indolicus TaxID=33030 RepID=G4D471_9FIRM|nr:16S rRNA (cytosine(1402)-N(4))-methyltransferase RsmH [Peptoniphilus indolicus]EGY79676.1 S-adenosyl-methyltransferase MraW [Peptoniphilus indolicus ATCC 29427]SUB75892.1 Ribosomal RNA small subunit methyltransferase H [Peptoniphilus indolicus]
MVEFAHKSVLLNETIDLLNVREGGIYVDGTIGGAGHSCEILKRIGNDGLLIGIDQDTNALKKADSVLSRIGSNYKLFHSNYKNFEDILNELNIDKVDGILLDLGVSSYQFDEGSRGFSYNYDARLDMRMDTTSNLSAWEIVNEYSKEELTNIIKDYSEERFASKIADNIVKKRNIKSIDTTFELVEVIKEAIPLKFRVKGGHPAKKTFQALRIETNDELGVLRSALDSMINRLNKNGRIAIISFHSLEDRIVKETFKYRFLDCICPPESPVCICDKKRDIEIITRKPVVATEKELKENNRAHSAKLRVAEKI